MDLKRFRNKARMKTCKNTTLLWNNEGKTSLHLLHMQQMLDSFYMGSSLPCLSLNFYTGQGWWEQLDIGLAKSFIIY